VRYDAYALTTVRYIVFGLIANALRFTLAIDTCQISQGGDVMQVCPR
jgi:hypothetical protein